MNETPPPSIDTTAPLDRGGVLAALATVAAWASAFPLTRLALADFAPLPLAAMRFAIAGLLVLAWLARNRPPLPPPRFAWRLALCGALGISLYNMALNTGQMSVSPGAAAFIINTAPVITATLAAIFLSERFGTRAWVGTGVSFAGVSLIAFSQPGGLSPGAGASLVLAAAVCSATFFVLQRPLVGRLGAPATSTAVIATGTLFLMPWLPAALGQARDASAAGLFAVAWLGAVPAAFGYATWAVAQGRLGASRAANFLYLIPPTATALAIPVAGIWPDALTLLGGAIAIAGVVVVNARRRRPAQARATTS